MHKFEWVLAQPDNLQAKRLSDELNISPIVAKILINRNIASVQEAKNFLYGNIELISSPFLLPDMDKAVDIILDAIKQNNKIAIYGDYDADGITSTFVLSEMLKEVGATVTTYIPSRMEEGYGLNTEAIDKLLDEDVKLLVTVDCGVASVKEISYAKSKGMQCIITDHHTPPEILPEAEAIINPKLINLASNAATDLAGVGVAWKTGWAVFEKIYGKDKALQQALNLSDIVALGTVADMVNLTGENRIIVRHGLKNLTQTTNVGLKALIKDAGIEGEMDTYKIGFVIGPRLNAVGRMSNADKALKLLQETNEAMALARAAHLSAENYSRQNVEKGILEEADKLLHEQTQPNDKVIVLASGTWHEGVVGIVASKFLEKKYLPIICMTEKEDEVKGSARSIAGFNIYDAIKNCEEHLLRFGGHAMAAGLSLKKENLETFRRAINVYAESIITEEMLICKKNVDTEIRLEEVTEELTRQLAMLEPFGQGNDKPVFMLQGITLQGKRIIGKNNDHLKFLIKQKETTLPCLAWGMAEVLETVNAPVDIIFTPQENFYNGKKSVQALYIDAKPQSIRQNKLDLKKSFILQQLVKNRKTTWQEIENSFVNDVKKYFPDRNTLGNVYRYITQILNKNSHLSEEQIKNFLISEGIPWETGYLALVVFYELKLINLEKRQDTPYFALNNSSHKVELENSPLYRKIKEEYNSIKDIG